MKNNVLQPALFLSLVAALFLVFTLPASAEVIDGHEPEPEVEIIVDPEAYALEMIALINQERVNAGLTELKLNDQLTGAAQLRAQELESSYGHIRPDGREWYTAFRDASCKVLPRSENLAKGRGVLPADVMGGFMNSESHRDHILEENVKYVGVGVYLAEDGALYWIQLFSRG